uniref:Uncharacterized protein n=1 Tax=Rhinopithecus bieti TaxID=61621 RepID=A0A2K6MSL9_RHIBE
MALRRPGERQCRGHVCLGSSMAVSSGMFVSSKDTSNCNFSKHASWRSLTLTCSLVPWLSGAWYGFVPDACTWVFSYTFCNAFPLQGPNPPGSLQSLFGLMMTLE